MLFATWLLPALLGMSDVRPEARSDHANMCMMYDASARLQHDFNVHPTRTTRSSSVLSRITSSKFSVRAPNSCSSRGYHTPKRKVNRQEPRHVPFVLVSAKPVASRPPYVFDPARPCVGSFVSAVSIIRHLLSSSPQSNLLCRDLLHGIRWALA